MLIMTSDMMERSLLYRDSIAIMEAEKRQSEAERRDRIDGNPRKWS